MCKAFLPTILRSESFVDPKRREKRQTTPNFLVEFLTSGGANSTKNVVFLPKKGWENKESLIACLQVSGFSSS